jgi:hypothetical protein
MLYKTIPATAYTPGVGKKIKNIFRVASGGSGDVDVRGETFTFEQARALSE